MNRIIFIILMIVSLFLISCTTSDKKCSQDIDCVPSSCCHPSDAVNKENAPSCQGQLCTLECVPNTIDCSQGKIKCLENECRVVLKEQ